LRRFGALAVDDGRSRAGLVTFLVAYRQVEGMMDALQRAVPVPQSEILMGRALRRQVLRQRRPLAAGRQHVEDRVQHLANVDLAPPSAPLGRRDQGRNQRPLAIR